MSWFKKQLNNFSFVRVLLAVIVTLLIINAIKIPPEEMPVIHVPFLDAQATTTPLVILVQDDPPSNYAIAHERCHVRQSNYYGRVWVVILNTYYLSKHGYMDNPLEKQAFEFSGYCTQDKQWFDRQS